MESKKKRYTKKRNKEKKKSPIPSPKCKYEKKNMKKRNYPIHEVVLTRIKIIIGTTQKTLRIPDL